MYIAIDQYGHIEQGLVVPRKDLMKRLGVKKAAKMYVDRDGKRIHVGYIISRRSFRLYKLVPFEKEA